MHGPPPPEQRRREGPVFLSRSLGADDVFFSEGSVALRSRKFTSSEVQAEVQRQMGALMRSQAMQLEEMREELNLLRAECSRLLHQGEGRPLLKPLQQDLEVLESHHSAPHYRRDMGKQQQTWHREEYSQPSWQLWRGANLPHQGPWRQHAPTVRGTGLGTLSPVFPAFDAQLVPCERDPPAPAASWEEDTTPEGGMIHGLQVMLNGARKAEARMKKALAARARTKTQWRDFEDQMMRTYVVKKNRFAQILQKQDRDVEEARMAQTAARAAVREAYNNADVDARTHPKSLSASEWEKLKV